MTTKDTAAEVLALVHHAGLASFGGPAIESSDPTQPDGDMTAADDVLALARQAGVQAFTKVGEAG